MVSSDVTAAGGIAASGHPDAAPVARDVQRAPACRSPPGLTLNPASLQLAVGARAAIAVSLPPEEGRVRFTWTVLPTPVAAIDSTAADDSRVYVRAVGPGSTLLTVQSGALGSTASVPVTVTPAP